MAKLPKSATLGPFTYRITDSKADWKRLGKTMTDKVWGYTEHGTATIYIQPDIEPVLRRVILLHEILHAAAFAGGVLDERKRREEAWVSMTAPSLMDALNRSPGLVEYLFGGE